MWREYVYRSSLLDKHREVCYQQEQIEGTEFQKFVKKGNEDLRLILL